MVQRLQIVRRSPRKSEYELCVCIAWQSVVHIHVHTYTNLPYICMEEGVYLFMYVYTCMCMWANVCALVDSYMEYYATHSVVYDLLWVLLFDAFSLFTFCRVNKKGVQYALR